MYLKEFEIRWSDVDANRHLSNTAYMNFLVHARMGFLAELGLSSDAMMALNIGPVVFYEHLYYFKEVFPGKPVQVSVELTGLSKDGMFFEFHQNFYDSEGRNFAHCEMMGAWIDLGSRKLTPLKSNLLQQYNAVAKGPGFRVLSKEDTRRYCKKPKHRE